MDAPLCNVLNATRSVLAEIGRFPCMQRKSTFSPKMKSSSPKQLLLIARQFWKTCTLLLFFFPAVGVGNFASPYIQKSWANFFNHSVSQIVAFIIRVCLNAKPVKIFEIFVKCYCHGKEKPVRREKLSCRQQR